MSHHNWQPNQPSSNGIWHKTTLQQAKEQQEQQKQQNHHHQSFQQRPALTTTTNIVIGQKRTINEVVRPQFQNGPPLAKRPTAGSSNSTPTSGFRPNAFINAPSGPPPLTASTIEYADPIKPSNPSEYSQRRALPSTPTSTNDPFLSLSHPVYKLPGQLVANFASLGIKSIYPWQKQCLLGPGLLSGDKNLVYSAPTGGGKSLVADLLMLKRVLDDPAGEAKAILVLPYVALVQEKVRWLRSVVDGISRSDDLGQKQPGQKLWAKRADKDTIRVVGFFGGSKVRATWADFDVAVCTMEKANALINAAITDCTISKLRAVVLDECHMIDDGFRGYLLELMTTKLLCLEQQVQIIAMSATLTNIRLLKDWLGGHSYETHYRPVPIEEHLVYDGKIYPAATTASLLKTATQLDSRNATTTQGLPPSTTSSLQHIRLISPSLHCEFKDPVMNAVAALANETARAGYGVLVFSSSRAGCESDAVLISRVLPSFQNADPLIRERRLDLLNDLRSTTTGLDPKLELTIPCGVAFHHAGLTTEERELIANAYDAGTLKVCVATASLAAGINLPARRVILHGARMGIDLVGPAMLRQMRGRAGRKGKDEVGETYLCCRRNDLEAVVDLMHADLPQIASCLVSDERRIRRALLEVIAIKLATSREALDDYVSRTMLACEQRLKEKEVEEWEAAPEQSWQEKMKGYVEAGLEKLKEMGFITVTVDERYETASYSATKLGGAIVASSLDPDDGVFIHKELERALKGFVMDGDMHVLYNFTPVSDLGNGTPINWKVFWNEMEKLDESGLRVMTFLGLKPAVLSRMLQGGILKESTNDEKDTARRYHRFYLALQLRDLCNEVPIHRVAQKYDVPRGAVQTLAQTCQGFAAGMIKFCEAMGWGAMAAALDHFADRLKAGARADLLGLSKITFVKSRTARVFWDNGFKTVAVVANADPKELVPVLMQAQPNKVRLEAKDEQKYMEKLLAKAKVITDSANRIWQIEMQQELMAEEE